MTLFLDIETLPAPPKLEPLLRKIYEAKSRQTSSFERFLHGTSLSGNYGQILCIGYAQHEGAATLISGSEPEILRTFWKLVSADTLFVGHNAFDFDLPFILKRSVIHEIKPTVDIQFHRGTNQPIYDTMREWDSWGTKSTSLDHLAKILGIPTPKSSINGSQVWDYHRAGRDQEIFEYCLRDVVAVRSIYYRLTFQQSSANKTK